MKHHSVSSVLLQRPFSHPITFPGQPFPMQHPPIPHFSAALNTANPGASLSFYILTQQFLITPQILTFFSSCAVLPSYAQFHGAFAHAVIHVREGSTYSCYYPP